MSVPANIKLTNNVPLVKACNFFMSPQCCRQVLTDFLNLSVDEPLTIDCLQILSSKLLGYLIIFTSTLIKLPQLLKILSAQSAVGISFSAVLLELMAITFNASYSYSKKFPFSAWGEAVFLLVETAIIAFLILWFGKSKIVSFIFIALYSGLTSLLVSGLLTSQQLWYLQASNVPLALGGKLLQANVNFKNKHTGHLSFLTMFLLFIGCIVRIFTSIKETGDKIIIVTYLAAALANLIIVLQILYYWSSTTKFLNKKPKKKTE